MGVFGSFAFDGERWTHSHEPPGSDATTGPNLSIEIHDSSIAIVSYRPANGGSGRCYLGFQPRDYFEDPSASADLDLDVESTALATWAAGQVGGSPDPAAVRRLLAHDDVKEPIDVFVETTVDRLCTALGLPSLPVREGPRGHPQHQLTKPNPGQLGEKRVQYLRDA